jgi:hypothetical protein
MGANIRSIILASDEDITRPVRAVHAILVATLMHTIIVAFLLGALLSSAGTLAAASSGKRQVYITASFTDKESLFIEDLKTNEVQILENGTPKTIELMVREDIPTIYGLLFDRSLLAEEQPAGSSYRPGMPSAAASARDMAFELIDKYLRQKSMWVASYDRKFHLALASTNDGFAAKDAINKMSFSRNVDGVFAYAGLYSAVMEMNRSSEKRRVVILFLETLDQESIGKVSQLQNLLSLSNVELIIISFASRLTSGSGVPPTISRGALLKLAQATAGETFFSADSGGHPEDLVRQIYNRIRTFYTLGFESDAPSDAKTELVIRCTRNGSKVKHHPSIPVLSLP